MKKVFVSIVLTGFVFSACRTARIDRDDGLMPPGIYYDYARVLRPISETANSEWNYDFTLADRLEPTTANGTYYRYGNLLFRHRLGKGTEIGTTHFNNGDAKITEMKLGPCESLTAEELSQALPLDSVTFFKQWLEKHNRVHLMYRLLGRNPDWHRPVTLPAIDFVDRNGRHWTGESFRGRPLVLNFWFSLCPPCLKEISELNTWRDTFPEVNFVAVNHEKTDVVVRTIERTGFEWPQVVEDSVMTTWLPRESFFPVHAVIDHNGYVRCIEFGGSREIHRRVLDTLRAVIVNGPLTAPRHYKELHHPDEYHSE